MTLFDFDKFIKAQDSGHSYETTLKEMESGRKQGHWIWYVFPQLKGLGHSGYSNMYGISSLLEGRFYLENKLLCNRLSWACIAMLSNRDKDPADVLGSLDAMKLRSSMTLFDLVYPGNILYRRVLDELFAGERCPLTIELTTAELENYRNPPALHQVTGTPYNEKGFFEMSSWQAAGFSMLMRTSFLFDCVCKGYPMKRMVERYLWYMCPLCPAVLDDIAKTLKEYLRYFAYNYRVRSSEDAMQNAMIHTVEAISTNNVLETAEHFDAFVGDCLRRPILREELFKFIARLYK